MRVTSGGGHVGTFRKTALSDRQFCVKCGGHLMAVPMRDGLPKFKDFPSAFGGSGGMVAE